MGSFNKVSFPRWYAFLVGTLMLALASCSGVTPTAVSIMLTVPTSPSPTAAPPIHYTPSKIPNVHLEFDYPGNWFFQEEEMPYTGIYIGMAEPRVLTVPTRAPGESHGTPSDVGSVNIDIQLAKSDQTLESLTEEQKRIDSNSSGITPLKNYKIKIDGYDAYVLETRIDGVGDFSDVYTSVMFNRKVFFIAYDQVYLIDFVVAEKDRGGEFEQGYDCFFKSLKIVP